LRASRLPPTVSAACSLCLLEVVAGRESLAEATEILADVYPDTAHVRDIGLKSAPDPKPWAHAATSGTRSSPKTPIFTSSEHAFLVLA
jgi:hypothetical protein